MSEAHVIGSSPAVEAVTPLIIDAGKRSKSAIRQLKEGHGSLMLEVKDILEEVRETSAGANKELVPVVIVYKEKPSSRTRTSSRGILPSPFDFFR